jgi:flagellar basal-body rod modification protein FlgD
MASKQLDENMKGFLKILIAQIQNQDPLEPVKGTEFVTQLVQFSSVEQSINHNKKLDSLIDLHKGQQAIHALNFIGKTVKYEGSVLNFDGKNSVPIQVNLSQQAPNLTCTVFDESGRLVYSQNVSAPAGLHEFSFGEGLDKNNKPIKAGLYRVEVKAMDHQYAPLKDKSGKLLSPPVILQGKVTNVDKINNTATLLIGKIPIPLDKVESFFDPVNESLKSTLKDKISETPFSSSPKKVESLQGIDTSSLLYPILPLEEEMK